ncbi:LPO_1073/Vpar_1526 family protein [Pectobacterium carotovorum]|uniref:LPO_1073/Vpar_1526 family protein n=1 Tax=Pectobacterium carotovorum TaxID=554 RepID=UPI0015DFB4CB|nr:LPO_1073/Vpar_1526 family protein [Pectobacterium carotovorum]MBA0192079.1 hypothetical protein [Pectobacterium carotovorum]MBA0200558.1 hypothetical protein [Pectobacterium carotovorum]
MFNDKNSAGDNANIVNTKGDGNTTNIFNNNVDVNMVTTIVKGILYDSLPAFQQEAREKVQSSIQDYINDLVTELIIQKTNEEKINNKLPSPDIQYSIYETAKSYAKAPNRADKNTLINLVVQKINSNESDLDELTVLDLAIEASSKLNKNQIKQISFIHYITNLIKYNIDYSSGLITPMDPAEKKDYNIIGNMYSFKNQILKSMEYINNLYIKLYTIDLIKVFPDGDLSKVSMSIPSTLGCVISLQLQRVELLELIKSRTGLDLTNQHHAQKLSPLVDRLSIWGGINEISQFVLTEVGQKVATAYLSTKMRLHEQPTTKY